MFPLSRTPLHLYPLSAICYAKGIIPPMRIITTQKTLSDRDIKDICTTLAAGGLVIYPTETCYGIGADATNLEAVEKLWQFKGGRGKKAVSVLVDSKETAGQYVQINDTAAHVYDNFLPGPITVISKSKGKVVPKVESERKTLGVRIPDHPIPLQIAHAYGKPFTATSANTSGKPSPYALETWQKNTSQNKQGLINIFIDAGKLPYNEPSTVVDTTLGELDIIRPGKVHFSAQSKDYTSTSVEDTYRLAEKVLSKYWDPSQPLIISLSGDLGTGKTHFTQGLAQALGITKQVVSPTYLVMQEYFYDPADYCGKLRGKVTQNSGKPRVKLVHIDTWRLHGPEEVSDFHVEMDLKPGNIIVIEWPEKIMSWINNQKNTPHIAISITGNAEEPRSFIVTPTT